MGELFASGRIVDGILAFMVLELIVLVLVRRRTAQGLPTLELCVSMGAGAALLLALRAALGGSTWRSVALWLLAALAAHLWDLKLRWTARRTP